MPNRGWQAGGPDTGWNTKACADGWLAPAHGSPGFSQMEHSLAFCCEDLWLLTVLQTFEPTNLSQTCCLWSWLPPPCTPTHSAVSPWVVEPVGWFVLFSFLSFLKFYLFI